MRLATTGSVRFPGPVTALPDLLPATTTAAVRALEPYVAADWRATTAGDVTWTCWDTALHVADDLYFYAVQLVHGRQTAEYLSTELSLDDDATVARLLDAVVVHGELLRRAALGASPTDRGFHVFGVSDADGFAAMGIVETLVHTYDIVRGLDPASDWRPPGDLAAAALDRLFPDAPSGDPAEVLLHSCGRVPLGDLPRLTDWRWDGRVRAGG